MWMEVLLVEEFSRQREMSSLKGTVAIRKIPPISSSVGSCYTRVGQLIDFSLLHSSNNRKGLC